MLKGDHSVTATNRSKKARCESQPVCRGHCDLTRAGVVAWHGDQFVWVHERTEREKLEGC